MSKRLPSIILWQSLIALVAGHVEAQSLHAQTPVPVPETTLVQRYIDFLVVRKSQYVQTPFVSAVTAYHKPM
jgi:hypothetical protein